MKSESQKNNNNVNNSQELIPDENLCETTISKNSFFNKSTISVKNLQFKLNIPKPLSYEEISTVEIKSSAFLPEFIIKDNEGIECINEEIVKKQSGILTDIAKQFGKSLKSGVVGVSLPIKMFEPKSLLERYIDWWSFAPSLLKKAGSDYDRIESFKQVIIFSIASLFSSTQQLKPFNPLLGETFEAAFKVNLIFI